MIVGLDDTFAPMGFRDKDNNIVGFDIDLAKATFKEMGLEVEFKAIDWTAKEAELSSKKIDCIWNGLSVTPDRIKNLSMSKRYCANRELVMSMDKNINIKSAEELKNYKIATQADSAAADDIKANELYDEFKDNVTEYKTYDQALLDMKAGRIDVVVIDEVYATYNNQNKEKLYESEFNFGSDDYAVGFRQEDTESLHIQLWTLHNQHNEILFFRNQEELFCSNIRIYWYVFQKQFLKYQSLQPRQKHSSHLPAH